MVCELFIFIIYTWFLCACLYNSSLFNCKSGSLRVTNRRRARLKISQSLISLKSPTPFMETECPLPCSTAQHFNLFWINSMHSVQILPIDLILSILPLIFFLYIILTSPSMLHYPPLPFPRPHLPCIILLILFDEIFKFYCYVQNVRKSLSQKCFVIGDLGGEIKVSRPHDQFTLILKARRRMLLSSNSSLHWAGDHSLLYGCPSQCVERNLQTW
jgi:hypothetical protein